MRIHLALLTSAFLVLPAARAASKVECVQASDRGQDLRDQGKLELAREQFLTCGLESCPSVVRTQCHSWFADLERRLPTVLLRVRDAAGLDVVEVRVSIDGAPSAHGTDGRSLSLDPGVHVFHFEADGLEASDLRAVIRESEKDRLLDVTLRPAALAQPKPEEAPVLTPEPPASSPPVSAAGSSLMISLLTASLGGVAVAGGVIFASFGHEAKTKVDHLRATCAPNCDPTDVAAAEHQVEIANTSLVIGAVAAAGAIGLLLWRSLWNTDTPSIGAGPVPGGAMGWVSGSF